MKTRNFIALLGVLLLLLCSCGSKPAETVSLDLHFEKAAVSLEEGHFFFAGRILSAVAESKMISFYDAETEKSTFFRVEVTEDPFGCMPEGTVTVCVLGNTENFADRVLPQKNKEYLFDTTLWVQQEQPVFLLPTFYDVLLRREGDALYYTDRTGTATVDMGYGEYREKLSALAQNTGYSPALVLKAVKERLKEAVRRDAAYFKELKFSNVDAEALALTNKTAEKLLEQAEHTEITWKGIKGLLQ